MDRISVAKGDLEDAVTAEILSAPQADALWARLQVRAVLDGNAGDDGKGFGGITVAWYFGAMVAIGGMGWLVNRGWEDFGGYGIAFLAAVYAALYIAAARPRLRARATRIPGGLLIVMAVCMTPLLVYGLERGSGAWPYGDPGRYQDFFPWARGGWCFMEAATVCTAVVALRFVRFPFLVAPLAFVLWFMSMDISPIIAGGESWHYVREVSQVFGLIMLAIAYVVDRTARDDFAFWLYLFGMLAFWSGLTAMESHSEAGKLLYALLNAGLIVLSVYLRRRVYLVFGAIGVNIYLVHLAQEVFKDSIFFPIALTLLGIGIIGAAVAFQKRREAIDEWFTEHLPGFLTDLRPEMRG